MMFEALLAMLGNYKTTVIGFVGGVALYVHFNGVKMPTNKQEWWAFVAAAIVAGLGLASKDATTGSRPSVFLLPILAALALTGCTAAAGQMTPEQLHEWAKVKDAHVGCMQITSGYVNSSTIWANADKGVVGKVSGKCFGQEITIEGPAK